MEKIITPKSTLTCQHSKKWTFVHISILWLSIFINFEKMIRVPLGFYKINAKKSDIIGIIDIYVISIKCDAAV